MKIRELYMNEPEILICACSSEEHQIVIHKDEEDKMIYCMIHLVTLPFWQRVWAAIKYIFGYKSRYGNFEEFIFTQKHANKLKEMSEFLKEE